MQTWYLEKTTQHTNTSRHKTPWILCFPSRSVTTYMYNTSVDNTTYLLTPRCRVLLEKLTGLQLVKKFTAFHGTRRFITALTTVRQLSLSWASPIQSIYPHPTSWRSVLILSTHLRLGLHSDLFPSGFPTKTLYTPLSSPIRATCPAHLFYLYFVLIKSVFHLDIFFAWWFCRIRRLSRVLIICGFWGILNITFLL